MATSQTVFYFSFILSCLIVSTVSSFKNTEHRYSNSKPRYVPPIPCRDDFAKVAAELFPSDASIAVEIGVYRGDFAANNLKHWKGKYVMVDAWRWRSSDPGDKNFADDETNYANYQATIDATKQFSARTELVRNTSTEAVVRFQDRSIQWLYIDALHTHAAVLTDLVSWFPKLMCGGLMSGDDYGDAADNPFLPTERWLSYFKNSGFIRDASSTWGVVSAVNTFAKLNNQELHVTWMHDCYPHPAWYFLKRCSLTS